jgi:hypothetical protein
MPDGKTESTGKMPIGRHRLEAYAPKENGIDRQDACRSHRLEACAPTEKHLRHPRNPRLHVGALIYERLFVVGFSRNH